MRRRFAWVPAVVAVAALAPRAKAHVGITAPPPEAGLYPGEVVAVEWTDVIAHQTTGYDIDLVPDPENYDPLAIVHDLPPDTQSYAWLVPNVRCESGCLLYVTQVNAGTNYDNGIPITIAYDESADPVASAEPALDAGCSFSQRSGARGSALTLFAAVLVALGARRRGARPR